MADSTTTYDDAETDPRAYASLSSENTPAQAYEATPDDDGLRAVIAAWPNLNAETRAAVLDLVEGAE